MTIIDMRYGISRGKSIEAKVPAAVRATAKSSCSFKPMESTMSKR